MNLVSPTSAKCRDVGTVPGPPAARRTKSSVVEVIAWPESSRRLLRRVVSERGPTNPLNGGRWDRPRCGRASLHRPQRRLLRCRLTAGRGCARGSDLLDWWLLRCGSLLHGAYSSSAGCPGQACGSRVLRFRRFRAALLARARRPTPADPATCTNNHAPGGSISVRQAVGAPGNRQGAQLARSFGRKPSSWRRRSPLSCRRRP